MTPGLIAGRELDETLKDRPVARIVERRRKNKDGDTESFNPPKFRLACQCPFREEGETGCNVKLCGQVPTGVVFECNKHPGLFVADMPPKDD